MPLDGQANDGSTPFDGTSVLVLASRGADNVRAGITWVLGTAFADTISGAAQTATLALEGEGVADNRERSG